MSSKNTEKPLINNDIKYKNLATNTFYSFLVYYGGHFFAFVHSFLLARLIIDIYWDYLILARSYITIIIIITMFLPPGLRFTLSYYIPRYLALNQKSKIKSLIKHSFIFKLIFLIPIFLISILIISIFSNIFALRLKEKVLLLYIFSPLILINSLNLLLDAINRGFSRFNYLFGLLILRNIIHIIPLLIFLIFDFNVKVEIIALIVVISLLVPFILNLLFILVMINKIKSPEIETESFKTTISKTFKYGRYTGFMDISDRFWKESQFQGIGIFGPTGAVTGYQIAWNYKDIALYAPFSFSQPLLTSFVSLDTNNDFEQIEKIYRIAHKITLLLIMIISGILFLSVDFMLDFFYLETRLIYSILLKLMVIATVFKTLDYFLQTLLNAQNKVKFSFYLRIIFFSYYIPLFFIGLIYLGVTEAIFFGFIVGNFISTIIQVFITLKVGKIKLDVKKLIIQYLTFFIPLIITWILQDLWFKEISYNILTGLGLFLIKNFDFLSISIFLLFFIITNLVFKTVTSEDIDNFKAMLDKTKPFERVFIKILNVIKKFTLKD